MGPLLASHAVRSGAGRAWNSRGRTSRVGGDYGDRIRESGDGIPSRCQYVPITRIPRTATNTAGPNICRISQGMVGWHELGQGAGDFKKPVACGATGYACLRAARAITPGTTTRSSAQNGHKHGSPGKAP